MKGTITVAETIRSRAHTDYDEDTVARIAWSCIASPGDPDVGLLVRERGAIAALQIALDETITSVDGVDLAGLRSHFAPRTATSVRACLAYGKRVGCIPITPLSASWPTAVDALGITAPLLLWVCGDATALGRAAIVIVGSETPTDSGVRGCLDVASGMADRGWAVVTTNRPGVDEYAIRGAGLVRGASIAVLGSGSDHGRATNSTTTVSEYPIGAFETGWKQLRRNQLIAALASKTVVVEPEISSPVLAVADHAHRLGRPVGIIHRPGTTSGGQRFARWFGATDVSSLSDVLDR